MADTISWFDGVRVHRVVMSISPMESKLNSTGTKGTRMFGKRYVRALIDRSAENAAERRQFRNSLREGLGR
jgi:hypothetical protein